MAGAWGSRLKRSRGVVVSPRPLQGLPFLLLFYFRQQFDDELEGYDEEAAIAAALDLDATQSAVLAELCAEDAIERHVVERRVTASRFVAGRGCRGVAGRPLDLSKPSLGSQMRFCRTRREGCFHLTYDLIVSASSMGHDHAGC